MKRNVSAAIALEHLDATSRQRFGRSEHVGRLGVASQSNDGRVFEEQEYVADLACLAQINQLPRQPKSFAIIDLPELDDGNHVAWEL